MRRLQIFVTLMFVALAGCVNPSDNSTIDQTTTSTTTDTTGDGTTDLSADDGGPVLCGAACQTGYDACVKQCEDKYDSAFLACGGLNDQQAKMDCIWNSDSVRDSCLAEHACEANKAACPATC